MCHASGLSCVLSRCPVFGQHLAKMTHLSARSCIWFVMCAVMCAVKMSHLWAASCQDDPSFGKVMHLVCHACCQDVLWAASCQDDPYLSARSCIWFVMRAVKMSFGQHLAKMTHLSARSCIWLSCVLSRCPIFGQHLAKMTHVSARSCIWFVTCSVKMSHDKVPIFVAEAVHRYYESRRRLFNDDQPARREIAKEVKGRSKKRNLQKKVQ